MFDARRLIFIHGSDSSSRTYKAELLRLRFPGMVVPDFTGPLAERMQQLEQILEDTTGWTIIGSSLGGTMAALFASHHPAQVRKLVLLAPALILLDFTEQVKFPIQVPCVIVHGTKDEIVPLEENRKVAEKFFPNLSYIIVEDDHRLHKTAEALEWEKILK
jgi:pimeloyl-ACP methyl ester carboxylesterase